MANYSDLRRRVWFLLGALVVYRIGAHIPVPGVNPDALARLFEGAGGLLDMFNLFSGGALSRFTVFAIGITPYISASIIMQLSSEIIPSLKEIKKEGEQGRNRISQYTRYATVVLATFQSLGIAVALYNQPGIVLTESRVEFYLITMLVLVTGTVFLMWLGEMITERGVGNGISMIIAAGIASGIPSAVGRTLNLASQGSLSILFVVLLFVGAFALTYFVVFVESGQRKIPVNYAKRQVGNKLLQGQSTHLPLKINMSGVIPPIFASSIILFPATLISWFGSENPVFSAIAGSLNPGQPLYILFYAIAIIFFCYFYTAILFNPRETADNLKKSGAFIPGIRPGEQTSKYFEGVVLRLTLIGAAYITLVCLIPEFLILEWNVPFYFGGTSILIMVVVTIDFMNQVQSHAFSQQYESLLRKANFKKA